MPLGIPIKVALNAPKEKKMTKILVKKISSILLKFDFKGRPVNRDKRYQEVQESD